MRCRMVRNGIDFEFTDILAITDTVEERYLKRLQTSLSTPYLALEGSGKNRGRLPWKNI